MTITIMEIVDNAFVLAVPGAMTAGLFDPLFWASLAVGFVLGWLAAFPAARWLIKRGQGHAVIHGTHSGHTDGESHH